MDLPVVPGQIRRRSLFGTHAQYRVQALDGRNAVVEALDVPGIPAGHLLRLAIDAVARMDVVDCRAEVERGLAALVA